jgi:hypothetical protein
VEDGTNVLLLNTAAWSTATKGVEEKFTAGAVAKAVPEFVLLEVGERGGRENRVDEVVMGSDFELGVARDLVVRRGGVVVGARTCRGRALAGVSGHGGGSQERNGREMKREGLYPSLIISWKRRHSDGSTIVYIMEAGTACTSKNTGNASRVY